MIEQAKVLTRKALLEDPKAAIDAKRGTPLSVNEVAIIEEVAQDASFDREAFSQACLFQARHLGRVWCPSVEELGGDFYSKKPTAEDAQAALVYVQQGTKFLTIEDRDLSLVARIASAFTAAGHTEAVAGMLNCLGTERYLSWHAPEDSEVSGLAGASLPANQ